MSKLTNKEMIERIAEDLFPAFTMWNGEISHKSREIFLSKIIGALHSAIIYDETRLADLRAKGEDLRKSYDGSEIRTTQLEKTTTDINTVMDHIEKLQVAFSDFRDAHDEVSEAAWKPWSPVDPEEKAKRCNTASLAELDAALARSK